MTPRSQSTGEEEKPIKNWQLQVTQAQVDAHEKIIVEIPTKLDTILTEIRDRPTTREVDAKIELAVRNAVDKQDLKYSPIIGNNKALLGLLLASGVGLFGSLIFIAIGLTK